MDRAVCRGIREQHRRRREKTDGQGSVSRDQRTTSLKEGEDRWTGQCVVGSQNNIVEGGRRPMDRAVCRGIREQHRGRREKTDGQGSVSWDQRTTSWKEGEDRWTGQCVEGSGNNIVEGERRPMDRAACRGIREQHRGRREKTDGQGSVSCDRRTTSWKEREDRWTGQRVVGSENNIVEGGRRPMDRAACRGIREQHRGRREKTDGQGSVSWDQRTTSWKEGEDRWTGQRVVGSENNIVEGERRRMDRAVCRGIREQHRGRREKTDGQGSVSWDQRTTSWKEREDGWTGQCVVGSENNIVEGGRRPMDRAVCRGIREQHRGRREKTDGQGSVSWDQGTTSWKEGEDRWTVQCVVGSENNIVEGGRRRMDRAVCRRIREQHRGSREKTDGQCSVS